MKKEPGLATGISEPDAVDDYLKKLKHPMLDVVLSFRKFMLGIDKSIGEGIYWNAPTFYYTGKMKPFNPKDYKRYIVGLNFYKQDSIRMIFLRGADAKDPKGILEGDYKDGRRLTSITSVKDLKDKEAALKNIVLQLIKNMG
jgi:hypothetical protein